MLAMEKDLLAFLQHLLGHVADQCSAEMAVQLVRFTAVLAHLKCSDGGVHIKRYQTCTKQLIQHGAHIWNRKDHQLILYYCFFLTQMQLQHILKTPLYLPAF